MKLSWFNICVGIWVTLQGLFFSSELNIGFAISLVIMGILNLFVGFGGMEWIFSKLTEESVLETKEPEEKENPFQ